MKTIGIKLITALTIVFVALACQAEKSSQTQLQTQYSLEIGDLPKGWKFEGESWNVDYGGESYTVTYQITDHNFVSHTISMYPNEDQAREAYEEWSNESFDSTQPLPEATYSPLNQNDDYRFGCFEPLEGTKSVIFSCRHLQRHEEIISYVRVNLDNASLTFSEVDKILVILDERLRTATLENKESPSTP